MGDANCKASASQRCLTFVMNYMFSVLKLVEFPAGENTSRG